MARGKKNKEEAEFQSEVEIAVQSGVETEVVADKAPTKSIVDPKYRNKYKGDDAKDFASNTIDEQCRVSSESKGKVTTAFDIDNLFALAALNGGKAAKLEKLQSQAGGRGYGPRMRMTLGNVIRASARKRHGIVGLDGTFIPVDDAFKAKHAKFMGPEPTHNPDGSKIKKAAPAPAEA